MLRSISRPQCAWQVHDLPVTDWQRAFHCGLLSIYKLLQIGRHGQRILGLEPGWEMRNNTVPSERPVHKPNLLGKTDHAL